MDRLKDPTPLLRRFLHDFFDEPVAVLRREADLAYLADLTPEERRVAIDLLRSELDPPRSAVLAAVEALRATELLSEIRALLAVEPSLSRRIELGRVAAVVSGDPALLRPHLRAMMESGDANLKAAHFDDIRVLPAEEHVELCFELLAEEEPSFARSLALGELNDLHDRRHHYVRPLPRDARYFVARRGDPALRTRLVESARLSRADWEVVFGSDAVGRNAGEA